MSTTHKLLLIEADGTRTEIPVTEETELGIIRGHFNGQIDLGMAVGQPLQFAVYEWSVVESEPQNLAATVMLGRPVFGDCFIWGVAGGGYSASWDHHL